MIQPKRGPVGQHLGPRQQYAYFPVSYPARKLLIHAMRPDFVGRTACFRQPETWIRIDSATVTCSRCLHWIELQQAVKA